jgi:putative PIN family toxin of toxin-antitoxin system
MLDSNVIFSALLFPGETMNKLMQKVTTNYNLVLSSYVLSEIYDVAHRKFPDKVTVIKDLLNQFSYELVNTPKQFDSELFEIRDVKDYPTLYSAIAGQVDVFVTGDKDFDDVEVDKPIILTPAEFVNM